jgi:hypothetical protein
MRLLFLGRIADGVNAGAQPRPEERGLDLPDEINIV